LLFDAGSFADPVAQVVQLGPSYVTFSHDFDLLNDWSMYRKHTFDTHAETDLPDSARVVDASAFSGDDDPFEQLNPLAPTLDNPYVDTYGIAGFEPGKVVAHVRVFEVIEFVHRELLHGKPHGRGMRPGRIVPLDRVVAN
jgi:hypothetical protein